MTNLSQEIEKNINSIMDDKAVDLLVICDPYNIQYATGIKIPSAHAQHDLIMLAVFSKKNKPIVVIPKCWEASAVQSRYNADLISYSILKSPDQSAMELLERKIEGAKFIGTDIESVSLKLNKMIEALVTKLGAKNVACDDNFIARRSQKLQSEIYHLKSIAHKTDHAINGYFHHLIADRSKSSMSVSENLRIHSLERDIEIEGYNACSRGVIGKSIAHIWAYAPSYGFASSDFTEIGDPIIADAMNSERGYWSNSTRIAIMADEMSEEQNIAYEQLNSLRKLVCSKLKTGEKTGAVYQEISEAAEKQNLSIVQNHSLGFSIGVSAMEAPFLSPGDDTVLTSDMILIIDGIISHNDKLYRSRDTVLLTETGVEFLNWYKDWREPYFAMNTI